MSEIHCDGVVGVLAMGWATIEEPEKYNSEDYPVTREYYFLK